MSLGEVADHIEHVCELADQVRRALVRADEFLDDAVTLLAGALTGSSDPEREQARASLDQASQGIRDLLGNLDAAERGVRAYLNDVIRSVPAPVASPPPSQTIQPRPPVLPSASDDPPVIPAERLDTLRDELPSPITRPNPGHKTHGRWIGPDGTVRPIVSGHDDDANAADEQLRRLGVTRRLAKTADVELKLAAHMVRNNIRHVTVLINNVPCRGRFSCDTLVPIMLPEGATLTVHGVAPNGTRFRKRYTGGARPWWR